MRQASTKTLMIEGHYNNFEEWCELNIDDDDHGEFVRQVRQDWLFPWDQEIYEDMVHHIMTHWPKPRTSMHLFNEAWAAYMRHCAERRSPYACTSSDEEDENAYDAE